MKQIYLASSIVVLVGLLVGSPMRGQAQNPAEETATETEGTDAAVAGPEREIVIGAGRVSGTYFPVAGALCRTIMAHTSGFRCLVESNANSSANLERLRDGRLDFAIVQSDWLMHAARGTNIFRPVGPDETLRAVMALHAEVLTLVVGVNSSIGSVADLKGKKVNLGPPLTYPRILGGILLGAAGLGEGDLASVSELSMSEQFPALCRGEIDVAVAVVAHPSPVLASALARCDLRLVPIGEKTVTKLLKDRPELAAATIPADVYIGIPDPIPAFGLRAVLVTTAQVEDEVVEALVRSVLQSSGEFQSQYPVLATVTRKDMASAGIALPLHDAARRQFQRDGAGQ